MLAREAKEIDGGGIIDGVEVDSASLDSRVDLRLLRKIELDALLETLPEVEGVVEKYSGTDEEDSELIFLGLLTGIFSFFLVEVNAAFFFLESEIISVKVLPSISSSLVELSSSVSNDLSLQESRSPIFIRFLIFENSLTN